VRSAEETVAALAGGADVIDLKEPRHGSLGRADPSTLRQVISHADGVAPVSVALGELVDFERPFAALPAGVRFAKLGLSQCCDRPAWWNGWYEAIQWLPEHVLPVAVVYADAAACGAPPPQQIIRRAAKVGCRAVLFDTCRKGGGTLFDALPATELSHHIGESRDLGMAVALAGSLDEHVVPIALSLAPDVIAVRSAACRDGRNGTVDEEKVRCLAQIIRGDDDRQSLSCARSARQAIEILRLSLRSC
jgi:uncharacterized protein (UPF0264 family)